MAFASGTAEGEAQAGLAGTCQLIGVAEIRPHQHDCDLGDQRLNLCASGWWNDGGTNTMDGRWMVDYWHGSLMALPVGTLLTPLRERKGPGYTEAQYDVVMSLAHDPDRVYFTTDRALARAWGARASGALLRVDPVGPVEPDPDFPPTSFSASQAVVVDVIEHPITMSLLAARKAFAAYERPGSYDEKGFIRPEVRLPELLAASGASIERFRQIGGRYPNPQRFALRDGQIRYVTDDVELVLMQEAVARRRRRNI